jgi:hypothetical protein
MLIRSQDKTALLNLDTVNCIVTSRNSMHEDKDNANTWYVLYESSHESFFLGRYTTKDQATQVLDMIANAYVAVNSDYTNVNDDYWQTIKGANLVFQMPADREDK